MTKQQNKTARRQEILDALGAYQKRGGFGHDVVNLVEILDHESDRGVVVILGSLIEDLLLERTILNFVDLTQPQRKNLTRNGGLLGSFDDRINLGFALGVIDQDTVETIQVVKAMRNACAHSRLDIRFSTPELRRALGLLFEDDDAELIEKTKVERLPRLMFIIAYAVIIDVLTGRSKEDAVAGAQRMLDEAMAEANAAMEKAAASREKRKQQQAKRPRQNPKGKARPRPPRSSLS
jgi:hypothetical protein